MRRYNITIIDNNLTDILALKNIVDNYCMGIVDVNYFLTIEEAMPSLKNKKPDIVFMDVMFMDDVIFKLLRFNSISIVMMAREIKLSTNIFEKYLTDFILKPLSIENVVLSVNRAIKANLNINHHHSDNFLKVGLVTIVSLGKTDLIEMKDIVFCMAEGKYTTFYLQNGKKIVSSKNLGEYEKLLNQTSFCRIHHGYIINVNYIISVIKKDGAFCELINNVKIPIAKRKQGHFNKFIKQKN